MNLQLKIFFFLVYHPPVAVSLHCRVYKVKMLPRKRYIVGLLYFDCRWLRMCLLCISCCFSQQLVSVSCYMLHAACRLRLQLQLLLLARKDKYRKRCQSSWPSLNLFITRCSSASLPFLPLPLSLTPVLSIFCLQILQKRKTTETAKSSKEKRKAAGKRL